MTTQNSSEESVPQSGPRPRAATQCTIAELGGYFLRLGALGFGGPVALVGSMHRDLVEKKGWFTEADYKEGLALAQLAPGPLAVQLAIYLGYVRLRIFGATLAGVAFCLPSFALVVALGWAYQHYGGLAWIQAAFYGVGASVIGIIGASAVWLTRRTVGTDWLLWLTWTVSAIATVVTETEYVALFLGAGLLVWLLRSPPNVGPGRSALAAALAPLVGNTGLNVGTDRDVLWQMGLFFAKAGAFVFGSGLAIVPFLYGGVVTQHQWLDDRQFLDAVAVAMITPGPIVITVGFIGYLVAGVTGACVAAIATFLPCYLLTVVPAPLFRKYGTRPAILAFVDGVTAAAVGAISGAVVILARRTLLDEHAQPQAAKIILLLATVVILATCRRMPQALIVLGAALAGLAISIWPGI